MLYKQGGAGMAAYTVYIFTCNRKFFSSIRMNCLSNMAILLVHLLPTTVLVCLGSSCKESSIGGSNHSAEFGVGFTLRVWLCTRSNSKHCT